MYHLPSIRVKIGLYAGILLLLSMLAVIGYATYTAREDALQNAMLQAREAAVIESLRIKVRFDEGLGAARTLAQTFAGIKEVEQQPSRGELLRMLKKVSVGNGRLAWRMDRLGSRTLLTERTREFINAEGHDADGRFVPYWNKVGGLHLEPCNSYESPGSDDWYKKPRDTGLETVLEPLCLRYRRKADHGGQPGGSREDRREEPGGCRCGLGNGVSSETVRLP